MGLPALLLAALIVGGVSWVRRRRSRSGSAPDGAGSARPVDVSPEGSPAMSGLPLGQPDPPGTAAPVDPRIVVSGLAKHYGRVAAVDGVSFVVEPGRVTGFLGPNGAGKTTTLRMILGLVTPTAGTATIGGITYSDLNRPARQVGAVLEASAAHKARTGRNHLRIICQSAGIPLERADEVLHMVGLSGAARRPFKTYSLGMRQRLGLAAALLGNPQVLILDEPANGLDPEGIRWMRDLLSTLATQGRTILVSSHLLSETQLLADDLVIIAAGKLVTAGPITSILDSMATGSRTLVRSRDLDKLAIALDADAVLTPTGGDDAYITGMDAAAIASAAHRAGVILDQLTTERPDLEDIFLTLTSGKATIR